MKLIKHWLMTAVLLLGSVAASGEDFEVDGIYYKITSSANLTVAVTYRGKYYDTYSNEYTEAVTIPATVTNNGVTYSVTSIEDNAFNSCHKLTAVTIPESVTSIGYSAFGSCSSLTSVNIPQQPQIASIGQYAFSGTAWLNNQPNGIVYIGNVLYCYQGTMPANTNIEVREGTVSISAGAFDGNRNLTSIIIPESVTSIEAYVFRYCTNLISVTIPENSKLRSIKSQVFYNCSSLTSITIPNGVTEFGFEAFCGCTGELVVNCNIPYNSSSSSKDGGAFYGSDFTKVTIGEGVILIGDFAFCASSLTSITIPESVTEIGYSAFGSCSSLTSITIPDSVTEIEDHTFQFCSSLTSIFIPESVTAIGKQAFRGCSSLTSINIPEGVTEIGEWAFYDCNNLASINISKSVTEIEELTFYNCSSLASITIPEGVTEIGEGAFYDCSSLTSITLPKSLLKIYRVAFDGCINLSSITCNAVFPPTSSSSSFNEVDKSIPLYVPVTSVSAYQSEKPWNEFTNIIGKAFGTCGDNLRWEFTNEGELIIDGVGTMDNYTSESDLPWYEYITSIKTITIRGGVTSIGSKAFFGCSNLIVTTLPESITSIGRDAFAGCSKLTSIVLPKKMAEIGDKAFDGCISIVSIVIPEGVTSIGCGTFRNCSTLTSISIPESVTTIGEDAFHNCGRLTTITLPKELTSIGDYAFCGCNSLTSINIPVGVVEIGKSTFVNCRSLTTVTLPRGVASIGEYAFYGCYGLTSIISKAVNPPVCDNNAFKDVNKTISIYVTASAIADYQVANGWSEFTNYHPLCETITIDQYGSITCCSKYTLDFSNVEGIKAYAATGYNNITGVVTLTRMMTAQSGEGLFIKGDPGEYRVPLMESTGDNTLNMLVGTLENTLIDALSNDGLYVNYKYTIKEGDSEPLFHQFANNSTLSAGEAYLRIPTVWLPSTETKSISYRFDDGTTDIVDADFNMQNTEHIYDLMGRRVEYPIKGCIYIVNEKKMVY